jgi:hypothetical protein
VLRVAATHIPDEPSLERTIPPQVDDIVAAAQELLA